MLGKPCFSYLANTKTEKNKQKKHFLFCWNLCIVDLNPEIVLIQWKLDIVVSILNAFEMATLLNWQSTFVH